MDSDGDDLFESFWIAHLLFSAHNPLYNGIDRFEMARVGRKKKLAEALALVPGILERML